MYEENQSSLVERRMQRSPNIKQDCVLEVCREREQVDWMRTTPTRGVLSQCLQGLEARSLGSVHRHALALPKVVKDQT